MIEINLLPKELQIQGPRLALSRQILMPAMVVVAVFCAMGVVTYFQNRQIGELEGKIQIAKARAEQLERDIQVVDGLVDIKGKITARIDAVKVLDQNRNAWVNVLTDLSSRLPEFLWLTALRETSAASARKQVPGDTAVSQEYTGPTVQVPAELEGYAYSLSGLANLIINLRKSGHFLNVDLKHAREVKLETHTAYSFALTCTLDYTGSTPGGPGTDTDNPSSLAQSSESVGKRN
jgi:Tfp pilus assembly protein PilN